MKILVVDDEPGIRHTLSLILSGEGHVVTVASDGAEALASPASSEADIVLCDLRMPTLDGLAFLERYRAAGGQALVVIMSAYGDDDSVIDAMHRGAYDYIPKPFRADQVLLVVRKAIEREGLRRQVAQLQDELTVFRGEDGIVGRSESVRTVLATARKVARHPTSVLVTGESGTGKELVARLVHRHSPRAASPFVAINCGAIPEALLESELFGHARGAFTGAVGERRGLFEEASGGTLFLDEIGELPPPLQVKLLRALQEGEIRRVGDNVARSVDTRLVAATSRDLEADVTAGRFRADLFYRVNVVHLHLPPLRERRDDIPDLARHFVDVYNRRFGLAIRGVAPAAMRMLMDYAWPGNVRELENVIERALVLTDTTDVGVDQLSSTLRGPASSVPSRSGAPMAGGEELSVKRLTDALERDLIARALERTGGNRTRAAELLELSHRALLYKIKEYGLG